MSDVLRAAVAQSHLNHNVGGWFPGYPYDYSDYIIFLAVHVKKNVLDILVLLRLS